MPSRSNIVTVLGEFDLTLEDFGNLGPSGCVELLEKVPSLDVEINLFVERNEHKDRKIAPNDEIDLGFLSLTIPYCQTVITEKFWTSLIRRLKLDTKYGTEVGYDTGKMLLSLAE